MERSLCENPGVLSGELLRSGKSHVTKGAAFPSTERPYIFPQAEVPRSVWRDLSASGAWMETVREDPLTLQQREESKKTRVEVTLLSIL